MFSEAEVREKIILPWLNATGFDFKEIRMEYSFKIRLGRGVYTVKSALEKNNLNGRADYLVKSANNINLFIIEVKANSIALSAEDKEQGISYARLISEGNIPPFVILTNGIESHIYDSITKEEIVSTQAFSQHPHVKAEFKINCDINAQTEALAFLISLSDENLLLFCKGQADFRMNILRSADINSGKKYIPLLYVDRERERNELDELLFKRKANVALITGPPQLGKTSFVCNLVEHYLDTQVPCLFYPAIGLKTGLLQALEEDFSWGLNRSMSCRLPIFSTLQK